MMIRFQIILLSLSVSIVLGFVPSTSINGKLKQQQQQQQQRQSIFFSKDKQRRIATTSTTGTKQTFHVHYNGNFVNDDEISQSTTSRPSNTQELFNERHEDVTIKKVAPETSLSSQEKYTKEATETPTATATATAATATKGTPSTGFIQQEELELLKDEIDLVSVVESYGLSKFKRTGPDRATCVCPFHDDHNPSMSIDNQRKMFRCFSCGAAGDVFQFVRKYHHEVQGEDELPFYQAVRMVHENYAPTFPLSMPRYGKNGGLDQATAKRRERIFQANYAAMEFYQQQLKILPEAGIARLHLRKRGFQPSTVLSYSMGFAPDTYFSGTPITSPSSSSSMSRQWGDGSLVNHLRDLGFTADEIFDAGLATKTKPRKGKEKDNGNELGELDYSRLMDRFRARLVVPIFDSYGKNVLGFGGRIMESSSSSNDDVDESADSSKKKDVYTPKYLNTPQTLVFEKKNILFGQHMAKKSIRYWEKKDLTPQPIVIVEGYMDAVALWQVGIREAVACMGVGMTIEQLSAAARIAGTKSGRIVLCLDNDDAGKEATERLCSGSLLASVTDQYPVDIRIATLPNNVKDPAEYIENYKLTRQAKAGKKTKHDIDSNNENDDDDENGMVKFRQDILDTAIEWSEWYISSLLSSYDVSLSSLERKKNFGTIFERLAIFISNFQNAAERTKRSCDVSHQLALLLAKDIKDDDTNNIQVSETVRMQLETDLVERVSTIADSRKKSSVSSWIVPEFEKAKEDTKTRNKKEDTTTKQSKTRKMWIDDDDDDGGGGGGGSGDGRRAKTYTFDNGRGTTGRNNRRKNTYYNRREDYRSTRYGQNNRNDNDFHPEDLIESAPHLSFLEGISRNDARWLGLIDEKGKVQPHALLPEGAVNEFGQINSLGQKTPVYFNSKEFNGGHHQLLSGVGNDPRTTSQIASTTTSSTHDDSYYQKGIGSLVKIDEEWAAESAEDALLRLLIVFPSARNPMKTILVVSNASGSGKDIEWSTKEKSQLFALLTQQSTTIDDGTVPSLQIMETGHADEIRSYLIANLEKQESNDAGSDMGRSVAAAAAAGEVVGTDIDDGAAVRDAVNDKERVSIQTPSGDTSSTTDIPIHKVELVQNNTHRYEDNPLIQTFDRIVGTGMEEMTLYEAEAFTPERAELAAQELYANLAWAVAVRKLKRTRTELESLSASLYPSSTNDDDNKDENDDGNPNENTIAVQSDLPASGDSVTTNDEKMDMSSGQGEGDEKAGRLTSRCLELMAQVRDQAQQVQRLEEASRTTSARVVAVRMSAAFSEGIAPPSEYEKFFNMLDDHLSELRNNPIQPSESDELKQENTYQGGSGGGDDDDEEEESYEDFLERKREEYGEFFEDDRFWSPNDITTSPLPPKMTLSNQWSQDQEGEEEEEEPLDVFMERMDREWGWVEEARPVTAASEERPYTFNEEKWDKMLAAGTGSTDSNNSTAGNILWP